MKYKFNLCLLLFFISSSLHAEMILNKSILNFYAGGSIREDIEITNAGEEILYLSATVFEINASETGSPMRVELKDPRTAGMLASPNRMIIAPNKKKILRVIARKSPSEKDKVYRIKIMPQLPPVSAKSDNTKKQTGVKVLLGYELLAFIRPIDHQATLNVKKENQTLQLINEGNTNVIIRSIKQCQDENVCKELKGKRLYAGQNWSIKLPYPNGKIKIYKSVGGEFSYDEY